MRKAHRCVFPNRSEARENDALCCCRQRAKIRRGRAPCGARGLKLVIAVVVVPAERVAPRVGRVD